MVFGIPTCSSKPANGLSAYDVDKVRNSSLLEEVMLRSLGRWLFMTAAQGSFFPSLLKCYVIYNSISSDKGLLKPRKSRIPMI